MTAPEQQAQVEQWQKDAIAWGRTNPIPKRVTGRIEAYLAGREAQQREYEEKIAVIEKQVRQSLDGYLDTIAQLQARVLELEMELLPKFTDAQRSVAAKHGLPTTTGAVKALFDDMALIESNKDASTAVHREPVCHRHWMQDEDTPEGEWEYFENASCEGCQPLFTYPPSAQPIASGADELVAIVQCINGVTIGYLEVMQPVGTKLYLKPKPASAVPDDLTAFDLAVADELPCVSHVEYDSHEICKHFAAKVRERLTMLAAAPRVDQ